MSIVLTLLLTMSTYKIVIKDWIPQKDYLTFMDWYITAGFCLILVIALWVTWTAFITDNTFQDWDPAYEAAEKWLVSILSVLWIIPHIYVFFTWDSWYLPWYDLLAAENKRLQEIADEVIAENQEMQNVALMSGDRPE